MWMCGYFICRKNTTQEQCARICPSYKDEVWPVVAVGNNFLACDSSWVVNLNVHNKQIIHDMHNVDGQGCNNQPSKSDHQSF